MSSPQDVVNFRRRVKIALVKANGDKCYLCGNNFPMSVYDFHHLNPSEKSFSLGHGSTTRAKSAYAEEAKKCIMVCANCHRLIEYENIDLAGVQTTFVEDIYYNTLAELTDHNKEITDKRKEDSQKNISPKPPRDVLKQQVREMSFCAVGRLYDRSDNAVRKWLVSYNLPSHKKEIDKYSDEEWAAF